MRHHKLSLQGMTFIELVIAGAIGATVFVMLMWMMSAEAREERLGLVQQHVFNRADRVQDQICALLRAGMKGKGVLLSNPNGGKYRAITFWIPDAQGNAIQAQLSYDSTNRLLLYDPNLAVSNNTIEICNDHGNGSFTSLDDVSFQMTLQSNGQPSSQAILVSAQVSDQGLARKSYRGTTSQANWIISTRTFTVNLRRQ